MAVQSQSQQVRVFRRLGYWSVATALLPLQLQALSAFSVAALAYLYCAPIIQESLPESAGPAPGRWREALEALLLSLLMVGLTGVSAVSGCVLCIYWLCQLADGGLRRLLRVQCATVPAVLLAALVHPVAIVRFPPEPYWWLDASHWTLVLTTAVLLFMAGAFALIGYERSLRLHRTKQALQTRTAQLQSVNARLARYLPEELPAQVSRAPDQRLSLQRRWLTVVFIDLCDFSAATRQLEAEALAAVLDDYLTMLDDRCKLAGGSLSKVVGDGALVLFELADGLSRREAARRATIFCTAIPAALTHLHQRWHTQGLLPRLQLRAGVASGYCSIGDWGQRRLDYTVVGEAVNLAARLQQQADPGAIWLDESTAALVADQAPLSPPRQLVLKGFGARLVQALAGTKAVDRAQWSAMVPPDSAARVDSSSPAAAAPERRHDRDQVVSTGLPGRTH